MEGLTASQMEYEAKVVYESLASADAPGYTSRQWSILLTQAQEKVVLDVVKLGFDNDEINRRKIHSLLKQGVEATIEQDSHIPFGYRVKFPSKYLHIVKDSASVTGVSVPLVRQLDIRFVPDQLPAEPTSFLEIDFIAGEHAPVNLKLDPLWTPDFVKNLIKNFNKNKPFGTVNLEEDFNFSVVKTPLGDSQIRIRIKFFDRFNEFTMNLTPTTNVTAIQRKLQDINPVGDLVRVKPISYDFYHTNIDNPFEKPYKGEFWRLVDSEGAVIITDGRPLNNYIVSYIERPSPIVTTTLTPNTAIEGVQEVTNCKLDPMLHRDIVYTAARLAVTYTGDSNNYQLHSIEGQR